MDMLNQNKASVVVAKIANEHLRLGDTEPPFLPKPSSLRKLKSGTYDSLCSHEDPIISLREMKYSENYLNSIGNIGLDPFVCFFGTPYQKELTRIQTNRKRIIISIDAPGAPVLKPKHSSFSLIQGFKPIFLYVIMLQCDGKKNSPVYQVLSQRQDATKIRLLLDTWKQNCLGSKNPHEIITDDSAALLLACAKSFAQCFSIMEYDDKCFDALYNSKDPPRTYLRLDRAHINQSIIRMLSGLDRNKNTFYSRVLGFLLLCDDINVAEDIIRRMFIVLINRYEYAEHVTEAITFQKETSDTHIIVKNDGLEPSDIGGECEPSEDDELDVFQNNHSGHSKFQQ